MIRIDKMTNKNTKIKKLKLKPCLKKNMKGDGGDCPIW